MTIGYMDTYEAEREWLLGMLADHQCVLPVGVMNILLARLATNAVPEELMKSMEQSQRAVAALAAKVPQLARGITLNELAAVAGVRAGKLAVVPVVPTEAMREAWAKLRLDRLHRFARGEDGGGIMAAVEADWLAMIEAAQGAVAARAGAAGAQPEDAP